MNKILRLTLMMLLAMVGMTGFAEDPAVTLDFTSNTWGLPEGSSAGLKTSTTYSNGTYSITLAAADKFYFNTDGYLLFGKSGSTLTLPAFDFAVEKIVVTGNSGASAKVKQNFYVGETAVSTETTGATTSNTYEIASDYQAAGNVYVLKVTNKYNTQVTKIEVYKKTDGGTTTTVTAPDISGTTPFTDKTTVTITVPDGTTVYYTTDGSTPSYQGDEYEGPFDITATTTVKAVAYDANENPSSVVSKEFVKQANVTTTGQGTLASPYTVADVIALQNGNAAPSDSVYVSGKVSQAATSISSYGDANYYLSDDGTTTSEIEAYNSYYFKKAKYTDASQLPQVGDAVVLYGKITEFSGTIELARGNYLVSLNGKTSDDTPVETKTAADIAAFNALSTGNLAVLTLSDAVVLYSWTTKNGKNSTYIRDASGALLLYNSGLSVKEGDVLNGTVNLTRSVFNNSIQAAKNENTNADNLTITSGDAPQPKVIVSTAAKDNVSDLVLIENVDIVEGGKDSKDNTLYYIMSGNESLQVYNGFYLDGYTVAAATKVSVKGIVVRYNDVYEIYPTETPDITTGINAVNGDETSANAPTYNLAGQRVGKDYKGVVIQNGKKCIRK